MCAPATTEAKFASPRSRLLCLVILPMCGICLLEYNDPTFSGSGSTLSIAIKQTKVPNPAPELASLVHNDSNVYFAPDSRALPKLKAWGQHKNALQSADPIAPLQVDEDVGIAEH